jgi:TolB-like protein/Tfp pilus assembly protein PilF
MVIISLLIAGVAGSFLFYKFYWGSATDHTASAESISVGEKSIAVMPFENMTSDTELEHFCDGVMDEILNHLSKVGSLGVTSRTSVKMYKGTKLSISEIGKQLGVTHILEGSVRKSANKVRITVKLINASTGKQIWSEDYDYHQLNDIFPVQTDVSIKVTEVLKLKLTAREKESLSKRYTDNIQAYKLYRRGRAFWDKRTSISYDSAESCYKRAIDLDPDYALAYAGLADCYTFPIRPKINSPEIIPLAKAYTEKALSLDSLLCESWTTLGFIQSHYGYEWEKSKPIFEKAIRLNPNYATAHLYYGNVLFSLGDTNKGVEETKQALALDPLSSTINWALGRNYYLDAKFDLAAAQFRKNLKLDSNYLVAKVYLGLSLMQQKKFSQAIEILNELPKGNSFSFTKEALLCYFHAQTGNTKRAREELKLCLSEGNPYWLAIDYIALKDFDLAMNQLQKCFDARRIELMHLKVNPAFDPIRQDPRFNALLKKLNLI